jgi:ubiquinone/menaquinone biosynthesis C-methylase UbiE
MTAANSSPTHSELRHPVFSRVYARMSRRMEAEGMSGLRAELLAGLSGRVVELGAGNGLNFAHYPRTVSEVVAVEPEPYLRTHAEDAATTAPVPVTVTPGRAEQVPLADDSVDAVVLCLVMCSLPDRAAAMAEVRRVLRPNGSLRFLEHTIAPTPGLRAVQKIVDATFWPRIAGGCHTATDPVETISTAGFQVTELRRLRFPDIRFTQPSTPHVLGTAQMATA